MRDAAGILGYATPVDPPTVPRLRFRRADSKHFGLESSLKVVLVLCRGNQFRSRKACFVCESLNPALSEEQRIWLALSNRVLVCPRRRDDSKTALS